MHREDPFDAYAEADLANGEGLTNATALASDNNTFESLGTFPSTLDNTHVHVHGVPWTEVRDVIAQLGALDLIDRIHEVLRSRGEEVTGL